MFSRLVRCGIRRGQWIVSASRVARATPVITTYMTPLVQIRHVYTQEVANIPENVHLNESEDIPLPVASNLPRLEPAANSFEEAVGMLKVTLSKWVNV